MTFWRCWCFTQCIINSFKFIKVESTHECIFQSICFLFFFLCRLETSSDCFWLFHCHRLVIFLIECTEACPQTPRSSFILVEGNLIPRATVATAKHSVNAQACCGLISNWHLYTALCFHFELCWFTANRVAPLNSAVVDTLKKKVSFHNDRTSLVSEQKNLNYKMKLRKQTALFFHLLSAFCAASKHVKYVLWFSWSQSSWPQQPSL